MKSNKMYLVDEVTLLNLLSDQLELRQLEASGVDNWSWYGEGREEFLLDAVSDRVSAEDIDSDIDFEFVAKLNLKKYPTIDVDFSLREDDLK